jgi:hypothetical protein
MGDSLRTARAAALTLVAASGVAAACSSFSAGDVAPADDAGAGARDASDDALSTTDSSTGVDASPPSCGALGGPVEVLVADEAAPSSVVADGAYAYWLRTASGIVRRASLSAPHAPIDFETDAGKPSAVVLTSKHVVYLTQGGVFAKDKQQPSLPRSGVFPYPTQALVAMSGDAVAYARSIDVQSKTVDLDDQNVIAEQLNVSVLAYGAPNIAFLAPGDAGQGVFSCGSVGVCSSSKPGLLVADGQNGAIAIAADSVHVYWVDQPAGAVRRALRGGGAVEVVMTGLAGPLQVALDETHVYVSMQAGGIARGPKSGPACVVTPGKGVVTSMSLSGDFVYFSDETSVGRIHK